MQMFNADEFKQELNKKDHFQVIYFSSEKKFKTNKKQINKQKEFYKKIIMFNT